jgi:hypothetical protein
MDSRSVIFLEVMIGIAVVGLAAFLVFLVARLAGRGGGGREGSAAGGGEDWYVYALAAALLVAVVIVLVWQLPPLLGSGSAGPDWRTQPGALAFFIIMLAVAGIGLLAFLFFVITQRQPGPAAPAETAEAEKTPERAEFETPSGARLVGLLLLALAFLLLNLVAVPQAQQYAMMLYLVYPASLAVALVLLFDRATRRWSIKPAGAALREWLLCDLITFLVILGFLNLLGSGAGAKYESMIWDLAHVVLFFFVFWLLDRKTTRLRFLVAYGYLIALPILLLIWQATQDVATPKDLSWWSTIWPFFGLAIIFFVLEVIALAAIREPERQTVPAVKDGVFVVAYGILLLIAAP